MSERLLSVGLDVGTTTTQMILSALTVENRASGFAVPQLQITDREVLYRSPVHFTPLLGQDRVDGDALRVLVEAEYEKAGIRRQAVDTGAIIITGETSRKENAAAVLEALAHLAGDFVVATAGPDLESLLAAQGAGAVAFSEKTGKTVLHMDIGGGTSNLALITAGQVVQTGCLNVGGRLVKTDATGKISYVSPVLEGLTDLQPGQRPAPEALTRLAELLTRALEMAAGLVPADGLLHRLMTRETAAPWKIPEAGAMLSFSGGVADCIEGSHCFDAFADIGPALGRAIIRSRLCKGEYMLARETIRATVIGAGCHSAQLSGSTVFCRKVALPVKNLPVAAVKDREQLLPEALRRCRAQADGTAVVLAMPGMAVPDYSQVRALAEAIVRASDGQGVYVCLEADMAKALGHCLCLMLPEDTPVLCIDRLRLPPGSYLDVGAPVGPALPVVIKTLVLQSIGNKESL